MVLVNLATKTGLLPHDVFVGGRDVPRSQTSTARLPSRLGSAAPDVVGAGTSGGRKKKWALPPWAPSSISNDGPSAPGDVLGSMGVSAAQASNMAEAPTRSIIRR